MQFNVPLNLNFFNLKEDETDLQVISTFAKANFSFYIEDSEQYSEVAEAEQLSDLDIKEIEFFDSNGKLVGLYFSGVSEALVTYGSEVQRKTIAGTPKLEIIDPETRDTVRDIDLTTDQQIRLLTLIDESYEHFTKRNILDDIIDNSEF